MRRPLTMEAKNTIESDKFYQSCCLASPACHGRIQIHHAFTYAGKRVDDPWGLLPLCEKHHREEARYRYQLKTILLSRVTKEEILSKYPKAVL